MDRRSRMSISRMSRGAVIFGVDEFSATGAADLATCIYTYRTVFAGGV